MKVNLILKITLCRSELNKLKEEHVSNDTNSILGQIVNKIVSGLAKKADVRLEMGIGEVNSEGDYELERLTVRKTIYFPLLLFLMLTGCDSKVTEDYLVGGVWEEKMEYKDGKPVDEPSCIGYSTKGLEFQEDGIVYNEERNEDFEYDLTEWDGIPGIAFIREGRYHHNYYIEKVSDHEIKLNGAGEIFEHQSCYLERKE